MGGKCSKSDDGVDWEGYSRKCESGCTRVTQESRLLFLVCVNPEEEMLRQFHLSKARNDEHLAELLAEWNSADPECRVQVRLIAEEMLAESRKRAAAEEKTTRFNGGERY